MTAFIIATRNAHKVVEIRGILGAAYQFLTLRDFPGAPAVVEDADTFAGNATKKAVELARWLRDSRFPLPASSLVLADDSGLEVDALRGAPGVHSARFAALDTGHPGNSADAENNAKLLRLLREVRADQRAARFRCVVALTPVESEGRTELFDGECEGRLTDSPGGTGGFGYDPLFVPEGFTQSFAELGDDVKNRISHRARALEKVRDWLARA